MSAKELGQSLLSTKGALHLLVLMGGIAEVMRSRTKASDAKMNDIRQTQAKVGFSDLFLISGVRGTCSTLVNWSSLQSVFLFWRESTGPCISAEEGDLSSSESFSLLSDAPLIYCMITELF